MAQAARLNLRMQKEIKLLLNDPPPGVSINLSEDAGVPSSLSSIEARIEGPEGTVYSKGVFVLKMQIPERYPFQPPNVTFVTPIYHPNIDNGGRVCLDILNLPPKGAWQPSLNISTVLMSIGLLLREPNPDDGLMAEISREYKYNRHVFDLNACSWTGKYANAVAIGTTGLSSIDASVLAQKSQREEVESLEALPKVSNIACEGSQKKMRLLGQKLSLKSQEPEEKRAGIMQQNATPEGIVISSDSGGIWDKECQGNRKQLHLPEQNRSFTSEATSKRNNSNGEYMLPSWLLSSASMSKHCILQSSDVPEKTMIMSSGGSSESFKKPSEATRTNLRLLGRKLSLQAKVPEKKINDEQENITPSPLPSSMPGSSDLLRGTSDVGFGKRLKGDSCLVHQTPNVTENVVVPDTNVVSNRECDRSRKKLRILSEKLSLKPDLTEKESAVNMEHTAPDWPQRDTKPKKLPLSASVIKNANADFGAALNHSNCPIKQNATAAEIVVVSDSEESSDECDRPSRSRLSLMRRRLARK